MQQSEQDQNDARLLAAVAEHMKAPLLYIKQQAELSKHGQELSSDAVASYADVGLLLAENYLYLQSLRESQVNTFSEQSPLTAVLFDVAHELDRIAKSYNTQVQLDIRGKYGPVLAHQRTLHAALLSLGVAFIESSQDDSPVVLAVHKNRWGIVTGVYSQHTQVPAEMFKLARRTKGRARQTMPTVSHAPMSGCLVADALLAALSSPLRVAKHNKMNGLAATLTPTPQLALL